MLPRQSILAVVSCILLGGALGMVAADDPVNYDAAHPDDAIARLQAEIDSGKVALKFDSKHGYLDAVLKVLKVPVSSQSLVFSKTSFQREAIAPWRPRALYFNSDVYIGWVQNGEVLEVASIDRKLGPVFYTLSQQEAAKPRFHRQTDSCLQCHQGVMTQNVPGLMVRSVYPDASGLPIFSAGTFRTDDTSPLKERWGGWYVTGTHGAARHMGNLVVRKEDKGNPEDADLEPGANLTDLSKKFDATAYLAPGSDIVALMVLTHQAKIHNLLTAANYQTLAAISDQKSMNATLGEPSDHVSESTRHRIQSACEPLVKALLFCGETPLTDKVSGSAAFVKDFAAAGPRDPAGRSLRDFDLTRRMFKYPCSFLVYSEAFTALPAPAKQEIYSRLDQILSGKDAGKDFAHLSAEDRTAIQEILIATLKDLPESWTASP